LNPDEAVKKQSARRTRRSFLAAGVAAAAGYEFYRWVNRSPGVEGLQAPLRDALEWNARVARTVFGERGLAPTYKVSEARELRVNGNYGLKQELVPESYRLQMVGVEGAAKHPKYVADVTAWEYRYKAAAGAYEGHDTKEAPKPEATKGFAQGYAAAMAANSDGRLERGLEEAGESASTLDPGTPGLLLTMDDVTRLPHRELVTQFKCIEGWSEIVHWGGVRLADLIAAYPPARNERGELPKYVYMETPNGDYYTGYHLNECMHPQSLLVTEMSGQPLNQWHGAPMRLHMPIKYGYKQIKRIGLIAYTDDKPGDYWTKLGYDWYAGL
jgi:hypothetical protein